MPTFDQTCAQARIPARVYRYDEAVADHGNVVDRLVAYLWRGDPLADAVIADGAADDVLAACQSLGVGAYPESVQNLAHAVCEVPVWVDWSRIARAGELFYRAGVLGGLVLGLRSLIAGYAAPDGNKPLVFSGRLREQTPRRVAETSRFVTEVCRPGGMHVGASGWAITVRVRLMHAKVRALISQTGRWQLEAWGLPINQHDMLATNLLFSSVFVDGLKILGLAVSSQDAADYMHLWRYVGWVMGIDPAVLPADHSDANRLEAVIQATQGPPDDDSRALVDALIQAPVRAAKDPRTLKIAQLRVAVTSQISRILLGDRLADQLELPRSPVVTATLRRLIRHTAQVGRHVPGQWRRLVGERYWEVVINGGLRGTPASFDLPSRLAPEARSR